MFVWEIMGCISSDLREVRGGDNSKRRIVAGLKAPSALGAEIPLHGISFHIRDGIADAGWGQRAIGYQRELSVPHGFVNPRKDLVFTE